jgi:hypothetical protein
LLRQQLIWPNPLSSILHIQIILPAPHCSKKYEEISPKCWRYVFAIFSGFFAYKSVEPDPSCLIPLLPMVNKSHGNEDNSLEDLFKHCALDFFFGTGSSTMAFQASSDLFLVQKLTVTGLTCLGKLPLFILTGALLF